jgi:hypothetical protein
MSSSYCQSPSRIKTLDLLAKSKSYLEQSYDHLIRYCLLARGSGCQTIDEASQFLNGRYQWRTSQRELEFQTAWKQTCTPSSDRLEEKEKEKSQQQENNCLIPNVEGKRVYISIKKDVFSKPSLLCQINDPQLQFMGDTGAIGRLSTDETNRIVTVDLKGSLIADNASLDNL